MLSQNASGFHLTYNEIYWSQMTGTDSLELIERFRWSTSHVAMPSVGPATVCITFILSALSCIPVDVKTHNWHAAVFGFVNQHFLAHFLLFLDSLRFGWRSVDLENIGTIHSMILILGVWLMVGSNFNLCYLGSMMNNITLSCTPLTSWLLKSSYPNIAKSTKFS